MVSRILRLLSLWSALATTLIAQATPRLRIATEPWMAWAPLWVAQEKGNWRRHGADVEVVGYTGADIQAAFVAGKVDFALMMAGTAVGLRLARDVDLVVLAEVDWSHGGDKLVLRRGVPLATVARKRIGIYEESPAVQMFVARRLAAEGLRIDQFELVVIPELDALTSQFRAGRLDCVASYEPYVGRLVQQGGEVIATTADYPGVMPEVIVARRDRLAALRPEQVAALLHGWIDAVAWITAAENRDEFVRICVAKAFFDQPVAAGEVAAMLQNVRIHDVAQLRARNLEPAGITAFLDECLAFAASRAGRQQWPTAASLLELRHLRAALPADPAAASPAK